VVEKQSLYAQAGRKSQNYFFFFIIISSLFEGTEKNLVFSSALEGNRNLSLPILIQKPFEALLGFAALIRIDKIGFQVIKFINLWVKHITIND